ncbi:MAG: DUF2840 domain-containing protein [Parasphingorhabdus sp.]|uniref:DUF2840 domain-containing protein n=1 Tax=Parasphingorhabdus sp. TaxID=2709688 RepID=UPI0030035FAD
MTDISASANVQVRLIWIDKRIQYWLRFGDPCSETITDRRRKTANFQEGNIFALVRWKSNDYGTVFSALDILQCVTGEGDQLDIRCVTGNVRSLLHLTSWHRVKQVFEHIDAIEALDIPPADVCPDHWSHVQSRIMGGDSPRDYTTVRHKVWTERREYVG